MPSLRRGTKIRREDKHKPEIVTGSFELHYEDIVHRNRAAIITIFAASLILLAAFVPAVHRSVARPNHVTVEAEYGTITNPELVELIKGDITASDNSYIEFKAVPTGEQE